VLKVCEKVAPWLRIPESQIPLGEPGEPEVLLWPLALQVHWMVSPGWIVIDAGEKVKPTSPTATVKVVALAKEGPSARSRPMPSTAATLWSDEVFILFPFLSFNIFLNLLLAQDGAEGEFITLA
jgi:hypothetical protein